MVKKGDRPLAFNDLVFSVCQNTLHSCSHDWALVLLYPEDNICSICGCRDINFLPGTGLSLQKCGCPSILQ